MTYKVQSLVRVLLVGVASWLLITTVTSEAKALCPPGSEVGLCPNNFMVPPTGCCVEPNVVRWCDEQGVLCQLDCQDVTTKSCCQTSLEPSCCNAVIADCVCLNDPFCCDIAWDSACVEQAQTTCGGCEGCSPKPNVCGWQSTLGRYGCQASATTEPTGVYPLACPACTPNCQGKQCGDDGCGGSCGDCPNGSPCLVDGFCQGFECTPDCQGKQCGQFGLLHA